MTMTRRFLTGQRIIGLLIVLALALTLWFLLRTPALVLGMAWYRMKDALT